MSKKRNTLSGQLSCLNLSFLLPLGGDGVQRKIGGKKGVGDLPLICQIFPQSSIIDQLFSSLTLRGSQVFLVSGDFVWLGVGKWNLQGCMGAMQSWQDLGITVMV